jgi:hypothetical protein
VGRQRPLARALDALSAACEKSFPAASPWQLVRIAGAPDGTTEGGPVGESALW